MHLRDILLLGNDSIMPRQSAGISGKRETCYRFYFYLVFCFVCAELITLGFLIICTEIEIYHIGIRIMDEIVKPLRDIQMDETEYTCLKAIVFFDPSNKTVNFLENYSMSDAVFSNHARR